LVVGIDHRDYLSFSEHRTQPVEGGKGENTYRKDACEQDHERIKAPYSSEELVSSHLFPDS
jgi:hypothetical protein